jgi:hypothetical protein
MPQMPQRVGSNNIKQTRQGVVAHWVRDDLIELARGADGAFKSLKTGD